MKSRLAVIIALVWFIKIAAATTRYVDASPHTQVSPYTSWATAATNIQDAINVAAFGETILVNNGNYQFGSINSRGNSRINTIGKFLTIKSVNGPEVTIIKGSTNSSSLTRCAYLTGGAVLSGFTLTNGGANVGGGGVFCETLGSLVTNCIIVGNYDSSSYGGGGAMGGTLVDCFLTNNLETSRGGGAYSNTLINCTLVSNRGGNGGGAYLSSLSNCLLVANVAAASGGAAAFSVLNSCVASNNVAISGNGGALLLCLANDSLISSNRAAIGHGGGVYIAEADEVLNRCVLQNNYSLLDGGGVSGNQVSYGSMGFMTNCLLVNNTAASFTSGGGAYRMVMNNCVVTGNNACYGAGVASSVAINCTIVDNVAIGSGYGAGAYYSTLNNSIIYSNQAVTNADIFGSALTNCCTPSLAYLNIANSFTNDPSFVDPNGDFHLQSESPCINAGNNPFTTSTNDLDGNPRITGDTVDVGAYEYQSPTSVISYAWLQQYGLSTDGSKDLTDDDGDGMNAWQEWIVGTDPTDATSLLQMYSAMPTNNASGVIVSWQSVSGKNYILQRSTNLSVFSNIQSNLVGQAGITSYKDVGAVGNGPFFYRVAAQ